MSKINYLTLVSGQDILAPELQLVIRQPKIKEISMIGEESFYLGCNFLLVDKEKLITQLSRSQPRDIVEAYYNGYSEYEVIVMILAQDIDILNGALQILELLFPEYEISFEDMGMFFMKEGMPPVIIRDDNYANLRDYLKEILCLNASDRGEQEYNPANDQAKAIAEKLKARKQRLSELKGEEKNSNILGNYVSALAMGTNAYTIEQVVDLTLFQLFDQVKRFGVWQNADFALKAQLAGAKDVEHVDWFGNLE